MGIKLEFNAPAKKASHKKYGALFRTAATISQKKLKPKKDLIISIALVSDKVMKSLNGRYRSKHSTTDVLSFIGPDEIIIALAQARRQALKAGHSLGREMVFLFVHGLLHIMGYEDETARGWQKMIKLGQEITDIVFRC